MTEPPSRRDGHGPPDAASFDRVGELYLDGETLVLYARDDADAWLQSATTVDLAAWA